MRGPGTGLLLLGTALVLAGSPPASGQQEAGPTGFAASRVERELVTESRLQAAISADSMARWARSLSARPHVAGTAAQAATRDSVLAWLRAGGLEARADSYRVYLPELLGVTVERLAPDPLRLQTLEEPVPSDSVTLLPLVPAFNAYAANGDVSGPVVYAGYGLPEDYRRLDSLGVSVRGRIVVARYGRSFRGIKAREASRRGAAGLLLYSDPSGDGYRRGDVYPKGPMRPPSGVQRGSILNGAGDPSTPGWASVPGARRLPPDSMPGISTIPVAPMGYGPASELLEGLGGPQAPDPMQGGLPFRYHLGPGPVVARLRVSAEAGRTAYHEIWNTVATIRGRRWPDEWVVVGGHRDAWGPGASDNVSGATSVIAAARAFASLVREGWRPERTVVFATWDAEEWGLIGSTEWVEANARRLGASAVAYLNQDVVAGGTNFGAEASPALKALVREAAGRVADPGGEGSVLDRWRQRAKGPDSTARAPVGNLGGGSDHEAFYQHLGIPAAGFGFGGGGGVYHSAYDSPTWMERFGDPGYRYHAASSRVLAVVTARLADADLLPYDFEGLAEEVDSLVTDLDGRLGEASGASAVEIASMRGAVGGLALAVERLEESAREWAATRRRALQGSVGDAELQKANGRLRAAGRSLLSARGLPGSTWSHQLLFVSDPANGYATLPLPSLRLSLRQGDVQGFRDRCDELAGRLRAAARELDAAAAVVGGPGD